MDEKEVVTINVVINDHTYNGEVTIDSDNNVDISALTEIPNQKAYYAGRAIAKIGDLLKWAALHEAGRDDYLEQCAYTGYWADTDELVGLVNGDYCFNALAMEFENDYYYYGDGHSDYLRRGDGTQDYIWAPDSYWNDRSYCECCNCYIEYDDDYWGESECVYCHDDGDGDEDGIIEEYCESHDHEPILFGDYKDEDSFVGLGFELEVDCDSSNQHRNGETASNLCSYCGLEYDEMRYAHDGSLNHGFECISQPHTVRDFWDKADKWRKMLSYLSERGYRSHDTSTCGLHVHVSRGMFGRTKDEQDRAIAKVYTFFDDNWEDIVKVSRRRDFGYCEKNMLDYEDRMDTKRSKYSKWKKKIDREGGHHVALNNANDATFEYRLGRGTLNAWSFFSWIDFVVTITKNARRINILKVTTNDLLSWLGGIKESTAKYIYKRGAFRKEMLALFPNIEWETDLTDNSYN